MKTIKIIVINIIFFSLFHAYKKSSDENLFSLVPKKNYITQTNIIDVIIPCHKKDLRTLEVVITAINEQIPNIRRIITISSERLTQNAEWVNENIYPFNKKAIQDVFEKISKRKLSEGEVKRLGWYYQQLLKLYAFKVIKGLSPNILIIDADTIFFQTTEFINEKGNCLYAFGSEYNKEYFRHMARFIPGLKKQNKDYSGICHHMLFQQETLHDIFEIVENYHKKPLWQVFCECVDQKYYDGSGASEYEIYFNFVIAKNDNAKIRYLKWDNRKNLSKMQEEKEDYSYLSYHDYQATI